MNDTPKETDATSGQQLGILLKPRNLFRTVASAVPGSGALLEIQAQLDGAKIDQRIEDLREVDGELRLKLQKLETNSKEPPPAHDWPKAVYDYLLRVVDFTIVHSAGTPSSGKDEERYYLPVTHDFFIGPNKVLTCVEALEVAREVASAKSGRLIITAGYRQYAFESEHVDDISGLVACNLTNCNYQFEEEIKASFTPEVAALFIKEPLETPISASLTPWIGQEIGFIHTGEADDVKSLGGMTNHQFDVAAISHFRKPKKDSAKSFVTGVLPGRVMRSGSPVFNRAGQLLGVIADTESYPSDAGRRAIVKTLLGHPLFSYLFPKK
jgi:hypothetical protein